jgi:hypothetical protein
MLSCDFSPQILVYPRRLLLCGAVRRLDFEQGRAEAALVGGNLAKIKLRVQRRMTPKKPISASI